MSDPTSSRLAEIQGRDEALVNAYADALLANNGWPTQASMQRIKDTRAALLSVIEGQREVIEKALTIGNETFRGDESMYDRMTRMVAALTAPTTEKENDVSI